MTTTTTTTIHLRDKISEMKKKTRRRASCGIICFAYHPQSSKGYPNKINYIPKLCMIQPHASHAWRAIMRGEYNPRNLELIRSLCNGCSTYEREHIKGWLHKNNPRYRHIRECKMTYKNYKTFMQVHSQFNWDNIIYGCKNYLRYPALEFPKGRRKLGESSLNCALREFKEETKIPREYIVPDKRFSNPIRVTITGSDRISYSYKFFVWQLIVPIDTLPNLGRNREIKKRVWVTKAQFKQYSPKLAECHDLMQLWEQIKPNNPIALSQINHKQVNALSCSKETGGCLTGNKDEFVVDNSLVAQDVDGGFAAQSSSTLPNAGLANAGLANAGLVNAGLANAGLANVDLANADFVESNLVASDLTPFEGGLRNTSCIAVCKPFVSSPLSLAPNPPFNFSLFVKSFNEANRECSLGLSADTVEVKN